MGNGTRRTQYVTAYNVPTIIACGRFDQYDHWLVFAPLVYAYESQNANHLALWMSELGHELPYGYDEVLGIDRYEAVQKFFDQYLKADENPPPDVLYILPIDGKDNVSLIGFSSSIPDASILPPNALDYVSQTSPITVHFAPAMDVTSIANGGIEVARISDSCSVTGTWTPARGDTVFTFTPDANLIQNELYKIKVTTNVKNKAGTYLAQQKVAQFRADARIDFRDLKFLSDSWLDDNGYSIVPGELHACWKFDETAGTTAPDSSSYSHTGTLFGGPVWQPAGGRFAGALSFDEVDDYVRIADFNYTNDFNEFSLSFWFKIDNVTGSLYQYMFSHGNWDTNNSLNVYLRESSASSPEQVTTNIKLNDGAKWQPNTGIALADGLWHMYTITVSDVNGAEIYIDANSIGADTGIKDTSFNPDTDIYIGARCDLNSNRFFGNSSADDGLLDDVRIYSYALSAEQIQLVYGGSTLPPPEPESICPQEPAGDINGDCKVNLSDYAILASHWLEETNTPLF